MSVIAEPFKAIPSESNLVSWAFSGVYDENMPLLIDAENPQRYLTKRKAIELIEALTSAFEPGNIVCVHSSNDVRPQRPSLRLMYQPQQILYPVLILAILAANCTWTGTNPAYTAVELRRHLESSDASYIISAVQHNDTVRAAVENSNKKIKVLAMSDCFVESPLNMGSVRCNGLHNETDLNSPRESVLQERLSTISEHTAAAIFSTSGTTGLPKMVRRTHRELILESRAIEDANEKKPYAVRRLYCTPIFHAFSFTDMAINTFRLGTPSFYMRRFDDTFAQKLHDFSITETLAVPAILMRLIEQCESMPGMGQNISTLRTVCCAGAPLSSELRSKFEGLFHHRVRLIQGWGMSEGGWFSTLKYPECDDTGSVGRPVTGFEVYMSGDHALHTAENRIASELLVRAPQLPRAYIDDPKATAETFDEDGWLRTGDVGYVEDGKVYLVDRVKDIIKVNGWSIAPAELEAALYQCPQVVDAAAVRGGVGIAEHVVIFVVPRDTDTTSAQILEHLLKSVSRFKIATSEVKFVETIPRNASGKILRKVLR